MINLNQIILKILTNQKYLKKSQIHPQNKSNKQKNKVKSNQVVTNKLNVKKKVQENKNLN